MTTEYNSYGKVEAEVRHKKNWNRLITLTNATDTHARAFSAGLLQAKAAITGLEDALHGLRCGFNLEGIPSEDRVKTLIAVEIARVFGKTETFASFLETPIEALATPEKVSSLSAKLADAAKQLHAAQDKAHKAELKLLNELEEKHAAEQRKLRELQS